MPASPRITVALPTFNGARHLPEALRSILSQDDVSFDLTLHDDRSEDETVSLARSIAGDRIRIAINTERLGLAGNWNRCVEASRTPFVAVFHQDDVMLEAHLEAHEKAIRAKPALGFVCGPAEVIDDHGREVSPTIVNREIICSVDRVFEVNAFPAELTALIPLRCSTVTLSKAVHAEVGGFDPSYRYVVDWDFWLRASRRHPVCWLARPTVAIRWHASSETHRFKTGTADLDESIRLLDEIQRYPEIDAKSVRPIANRRLARAFLNRAYDAARGGDRRLMKRALIRGIQLDCRVLSTIATDPHLAARLAACWLRLK